MTSIANKIPKNPVTGRVDLDDIVKFMTQNPSEMDALMGQMAATDINKTDVDLSTYGFASLAPTIEHESFWVVQLETMGMVDAAGRAVDPSEGHGSAGLRPTFMIYIYETSGKHRVMHETTGLPDSKTVLQAIRLAIAKPIPPLKPCLPRFLLISIRLQQHLPTLKPFLDSLPAPFHWRVETREEAEGLSEGIHQLNVKGVVASMELAEKAKSVGNEAFSRKERAAAIKAYTEAIGHLIDVLSMKPDLDEEAKAKNLLAVCYSNRAATYLIPGAGQDVERALLNGKKAEMADPSYAKGYIRQATASEALGKLDDAQDAIARALRRPDLENDKNLVDRLIDLLTGGKGMSNDEGTFKNWMLDVLINDRRSSERLSGIDGEWRRRCDEQFARWKR